jgi:proline dehydrogenase
MTTIAHNSILISDAANALRALALDTHAKAFIAANPELTQAAQRVASRYVAGTTIEEALKAIARANHAGHHASVDYMGESTSSAEHARSETQVFLQLIEQIHARQLDCSISYDISHLGSTIDFELGLEHSRQLARATQRIGQELIISMEGSDRTDDTLRTHGELCKEFEHVGIRIQARLHRTAQDLPILLKRPGRICLVKGAYFEPETIALPREGTALQTAYEQYAQMLLQSKHKVSIATHDEAILQELHAWINSQSIDMKFAEFEVLLGLGPEQLELSRSKGYATREYIVFGQEWYLYVLNRMAEKPARVYQALIDLASA